MKKTIKLVAVSFLTLILISTSVKTNAQSSFTGTAYKPATQGEIPVLDATIDTLNLQFTGYIFENVKIGCRILKTSGTIAGTVRLYGSIYGTTGTWTPISDTMTLANQAINYHEWNLVKPAFKYLMFLQSGGTTMAGTISAKAYGIKPN